MMRCPRLSYCGSIVTILPPTIKSNPPGVLTADGLEFDACQQRQQLLPHSLISQHRRIGQPTDDANSSSWRELADAAAVRQARQRRHLPRENQASR